MIDFAKAAADLGCELAVIRAVAKIEGGSGFQADGRLRILFESYQFYKNLKANGKDAAALALKYPALITTRWLANYGKFSEQWRKLDAAAAIDRQAAYESCSWGMFQPMGMYYEEMGFATVFEMVASFSLGEQHHLDGFVKMIQHRGLAGKLAAKDWAGFALAYNGAGYRANRYDTKLQEAYMSFI